MSSDDVLDRAMEMTGAKRYQNYVAVVCPFHEDNKPSLLVYEDHYRCSACGAYGWTEKLLESASLRPARRKEKAEYHPHIPPKMSKLEFVEAAHRHLVKHEEYQEYLDARGLHAAVRKYKLGYWDGWYVVPSFHSDGSLRDILFRAGRWVQQQTGERFFQIAGQKPGVYVPDWKKEGTTMFITFGLFDAISVALLGFPSATPSIGKSAINPDWFAFWPYRLLVLPDRGEEREANKLAAGLDWRGRVIRLPYPDGAKDPNDLLQLDPEDLRQTLNGLVSGKPNCNRVGYTWQDQPSIGGSISVGGTV